MSRYSGDSDPCLVIPVTAFLQFLLLTVETSSDFHFHLLLCILASNIARLAYFLLLFFFQLATLFQLAIVAAAHLSISPFL